MSSKSFSSRGGVRRRRIAVTAALFGLVGSMLAFGAPAQAASTSLVISEVYGGGGNAGTTWRNDFIELYNPTNAPVSVNGWSVQGRPATNTAAPAGANITPLSGTVPAHGYYLVQEAAGTGGTKNLPTPDAIGTMAIAAGGWQIWLSNGTAALDPADGNVIPLPAAIVDLVGGATNATSFETARIGSPAPGNATSITRNATGTDTDSNLADFTIASTPTPRNTLGETEPPAALPLVATDPGDKTYTANRPISSFTMQATGGTGARSWSVSPSLPTGLTLNAGTGQISGTPTVTGTTEITATVTDSATPPATASATFVIAVEPQPDLVTIGAVQGTGAASPVAGSRVRVQGVVTATYPSGTGNLGGFYLQTGGRDGVDYDTPGASDAIFVFMGLKTSPAVGASVEVTGGVSEFFGSTELTPDASADVVTLPAALPPVVPGDTVPGTDCALPGSDCLTGAALEAEREAHEGEAFLPTGDYTVTDSYDGSPFTQDSSRGFQMQGEIGLAANSTDPLMITTELYDQSDTDALAQRHAWNDAHGIVLDDGADIDYTSASVEDVSGFPWLTLSHTVRVGAAVTFVKPVILEFRRDLWRLQPETKVAAGSTGSGLVQFEQDRPAQPDDVGGNLKIATFNMLNYFNTVGEEWADSDGPGGARTCTYYTDRATPSNRISNNTCEQHAVDPVTGLPIVLPGPRGAATQVSFLRQEAKELQAINTMNADVMSLEEVENSIKLHDPALDGARDANRDDALSHLVDRLNAVWAAAHPAYVGNRWAFAPSPRPEAQPTVTEQDAIRSAFIYNPNTVELVGRSQILVNSAPFRNAREPLAQAFKAVGSGSANAFGVIVNHFKSKGGPTAPATVNGDNVDTGDGAGFYNGDRKRQAAALVDFSARFAAERGVDAMFLTGDYNAYAMEDPIQVITDAGFHDVHPANGERTYSFGGLAGSLDHVFANDAAETMVTGSDVWSINANESVYYEYSRYNSNVTNLYDESAFRSSDHNPEIIGIATGDVVPDPDRDVVQVLATNDFHGRILDDPGSAAAGAASLAGAVKDMRAQNPDTIFAAAGDLIGASTFESFIANDKPTIDALNEAGLEVSAAGNHEFDKGYHDLVDRVMASYDPTTNPYGGAEWQYIAANVRMKADHSAALPETWYRTLPDGHTVGFVGAVTEDLPALVAGDGIADIEVTDIVDSVNHYADQLKGPGGCGATAGCDLVVMLVHEGAASTSYAAVTDDSTFAHIVRGADENIDAIVSGHTHLAYNHKVPVPEWATEGRAVTERPVVSAGQYGAFLNRLRFEFEPGTDDLVDIRQSVVSLKDFDADPATQAIVDDAVADAATAGNTVLGSIEDPFRRARRTDPTAGTGGAVVENRGGESTLGNQIAEIQRWKTGADIGFMNPGGLRADLLGTDGDPRPVTYRQAADVQPFANTLVTMDLTGDQIKTILEQQWQRDADGNVPSRPFLRLGTSDGFTFTQDATRPEGDRITGMWLNGEPLQPDATYRVSATSFLSSGTGDNFWGFAAATNEQDTGKSDLEAVVDYMAEFADPLAVDYAQHAVGVHFAGGAPASYGSGDTLAFTLSSLAMTGADDVQDSQVEVLLGDTVLGTFPVSNPLGSEPDDEAGTASVTVVLPDGLTDGSADVVVRGTTTGTEAIVPIPTTDGLPDSEVLAVDASMVYGETGEIDVFLSPSSATGTVSVLDGSTTLGSATLAGAAATVVIPAGSLDVGEHELTVVYGGDPATSGSQGTVTMTVTKATPTLTATPTPASVQAGQTSSIAVTVAAAGVSPTGTVTASVGGSVVDTATLSGGAATLTVGPFTTPGDRTVTIDYAGDARTAAGSTTTLVAVTPKDPVTTTTTATAAPMVYGTPGTVSVTVTSTEPTSGSLQLLEGTTVLASGSVAESGAGTLTIPGTALPVGTHTLTVKYLGDSANKPSQTTVQVVVSKAASTTQVAVTPSQIGVWQSGATAQVTVTAAGFTPTGSVVVKVDGLPVGTANLVNGTATVPLPRIPFTGDRSVTASYSGDGNANASQSAAATLSVVKVTPTVTAEHSPSVVRKSTKVTLTVRVQSDGFAPFGLVRIDVPGQGSQYAAVVDGRATFGLDQFKTTGARTVSVTYLGDLWTEAVTITHVINVVN